MVRAAADELAAQEARQVLQQSAAVALGTGSYRPADARRVRDSYLAAARSGTRRPAEPVEMTEWERRWLGYDMLES